MGLDQYLSARVYVSKSDYSRDEIKDNKTFKEITSLLEADKFLDSNGFAGMEISLPVGYWCKSNQVHNWFVENAQGGVDECQSAYVSREQLKELKELCEKVIAVPEMAEELLPRGAGFFFGSTNYDEYYFNDLNNTIKIINRCLGMPEDYSFSYQSSW